METFLIYIGKAALAAGAFYLLYRALFQHQKHFTFNRIYLPVSLALSFLIPLITFTSIRYIEAAPVSHDGFAYLAENSTVVEPAFQWQWYHYLSAIYLLGALGFLLYLILGHARAISIIRKSRLQKLFNVKVNVTFRDVHPFSFFNKIVLSEKTLYNPSLPMIVQHEEIHVRGKHTFDILFTEILFLLQWFNPFAWLLKDAIKNNLEFLTDHELTQTNDAQQYQLAMVGLAHKQGVAPFLTALNGSQLKNRIIMMKKKTENKYALLKQLVVLPLLAVLVMGLSNKEVKTEIVPAKEKMDIVVDGKTISTDDPAFKNLDFSKGFDGREIMLALGIEDNVILNGYTDETDPNTYFIQTSKYVLGTNPEFDELISNPEEKNKEKTPTKTLTAIDGKILSDDELNKLDGKEFESAVILSGDEAVQKYGEEVKDASVVDFKTGESNLKVYSNTSRSEFTVKGKITDTNGNPLSGAAILVKGKTVGTITDTKGNYELKLDNENEILVYTIVGFEKKEVNVDGKEKIDVELVADENANKGEIQIRPTKNPKAGGTGSAILFNSSSIDEPLYVVDGKVQPGINNLDPETIESINVLKGESATAKYAELGKNGVVEITIKEGAKSNSGTQIKIKGQKSIVDKNPLILLDGEEIDKQRMDELNSDEIASIDVLKDASAVGIYGEEAKDGVILINTKSEEITSELDLRKFITKRIKYPTKAQKANNTGTAKVFVKVNSEGIIYSVSEEKVSDAIPIEEVVVVGYGPKPEEIVTTDNSNDFSNVLTTEAKRVLQQLPKLKIPEFKGETLVFTVKFVLQEK